METIVIYQSVVLSTVLCVYAIQRIESAPTGQISQGSHALRDQPQQPHLSTPGMLRRIVDHPCEIYFRETHESRSQAYVSDVNRIRTMLLASAMLAGHNANKTTNDMILFRNIQTQDVHHKSWPFVDKFHNIDLAEAQRRRHDVYNSLEVNLYLYSMYLYQLLTNERYWNQRPQPTTTSFQQQLVNLIETDFTGLACQLQQISHGSTTTELSEVKDRVKTTLYEPHVNESVTDMDKLAYVILDTFVSDYIDFIIRFLQ